ncbi:MAG: hypothetical protein HY719_11520, partial [Planctomycetes bacterium]|nr:hypothetical protein [Planctomycetota bacterium]
GQVVAFVPRHAIEGRAPAEVARTLTEAFDFSLRALLVKEEGDTVEMDLEGMAERLPVYCNTLSQRDPLVMVGYTCVRYGAPARAITDRR